MTWQIFLNKNKVKKNKLNKAVLSMLDFLVKDLKEKGFHLYDWPNFSKLKGSNTKYHCHLIKGKPTYVCCWEVIDKHSKMIEVYYVGTHENAPY